jgi:hypothetical protein
MVMLHLVWLLEAFGVDPGQLKCFRNVHTYQETKWTGFGFWLEVGKEKLPRASNSISSFPFLFLFLPLTLLLLLSGVRFTCSPHDLEQVSKSSSLRLHICKTDVLSIPPSQRCLRIARESMCSTPPSESSIGSLDLVCVVTHQSGGQGEKQCCVTKERSTTGVGCARTAGTGEEEPHVRKTKGLGLQPPQFSEVVLFWHSRLQIQIKELIVASSIARPKHKV